MSKLSFMKWYPADWINDTRCLSALAKGAWIDILCFMWNAPERGRWEGTKDQLFRLIGCRESDIDAILSELPQVGCVTFRNNRVTLENRRMLKQEKHYTDHAKRQAEYRKRHKSDETVTDKTLDVRLLKTLDSTRLHPEGSPPVASLSEYVNGWKKRDQWDRKANAAGIAEGLKKFKLGFRVEEDLYQQIMGEGENGAVRSKSISEQVAERRRTQGLEKLRADPSTGEVFAGIRGLPKVQPET